MSVGGEVQRRVVMAGWGMMQEECTHCYFGPGADETDGYYKSVQIATDGSKMNISKKKKGRLENGLSPPANVNGRGRKRPGKED